MRTNPSIVRDSEAISEPAQPEGNASQLGALPDVRRAKHKVAYTGVAGYVIGAQTVGASAEKVAVYWLCEVSGIEGSSPDEASPTFSTAEQARSVDAEQSDTAEWTCDHFIVVKLNEIQCDTFSESYSQIESKKILVAHNDRFLLEQSDLNALGDRSG